ncbi:glutathione S-transferase family protein [Stigmatella erecta]|uniref:Glutathione S-transferase n=1 Tax=Stigmatella erecta TaxID=83460 RepID=A0A1I0IMU2_9BACT|nr:glutathione S-transferase [Stigmatella erecta]SET98144.1 Glutathione S-transferase [Stigmatella erecta]
MELWYAPTSPFARKVRIAAHELGLAGRLRLVEVNPWTDARLRALNPLSKVPTLVLDSGEVLYESGVLCEYLDSLAPEPHLFPSVGPPRWRALLLQGLADGANTAAGRLFAEERRPAHLRAEDMMDRFRQAIGAALHEMEPQALLTGPLSIGEVSAATLLGYLDFRWPERDWRASHPRLAAWFQQLDARPSMRETRHRLPAGG